MYKTHLTTDTVIEAGAGSVLLQGCIHTNSINVDNYVVLTL